LGDQCDNLDYAYVVCFLLLLSFLLDTRKKHQRMLSGLLNLLKRLGDEGVIDAEVLIDEETSKMQ